MSEAKRIIAYGCTHHPLHDPEAVDWLLSLIVKEKPDVIVDVGDGIEANAASQWDDAKELAIDLGAEYAKHNAFLAEVRKAAPKAKRVYRAGNHDDNVVRAGRLDPRIRSICDWRSLKNQPELEHWTVCADYNYSRRLGCSQFGQIFLAHGFETTTSQLPRQALYFTKNWPFGLLITAHTHRPHKVKEVYHGDLPLDRFHADVGCLRNLEAPYMERKKKWNWGHAAFVGEFMELKSPRMSKEWGGDVQILRMYDEKAEAA